MRVGFLRFIDDAICPTKGSPEAAGFDLYSTEEVIVSPSSLSMFPTDIDFKIHKGYFSKIHSRSSLAMQFTDVSGGVIDSDFRGPVSVVFFNFSRRYFEVKKGQRLAQTVFQKISQPALRKVLIFDDRTQRHTGVFGSSDKSVNKGIGAF